MEHVPDAKLRRGISVASILMAYLLPSVGMSSYHNIERELSIFFPYLMLIYITPTPAFDSYELKVVPIWLTLLLFIPTFYMTNEAYQLFKSSEQQVLRGLKIIEAAIVQIFILFSAYLSETDDTRSFIPYSFLLIIALYAVAVAKWHIVASKAALETN